MTTINFNHCDASVATSDPAYQNVTATTGTLVANATDSTGSPTGISVTLTSVDDLNLSTSQQNVVAISPFIKEVCDYYQFGFGESSRNIILEYAGFSANEEINIVFAGFRAGLTRSTTLTVNGNSYIYNNNGSTTSPTGALSFNEPANGSGVLTITFTSPTLEVFYLTALQVNYGGTATIAPDDMTDGESSVALNPVGLGTLTSWTIDGVATTGTDTTIDNLDIATLASESGAVGPSIGTATIEVSDGVNTASATNTNSAKAGYDSVDVVTPDTVSPLVLYTLMSNLAPPLTIATDDTFYYPTANASVINDDGTYNVNPVPYGFSYQDDTDGKWYSMTITTSGEGGGSVIGSIQIESTAITSITIQSESI